MSLILPTILFFGVLTWDLFTDYKKWLKDKAVKHTKEAWERAILLLPSTICFTMDLPIAFWKALIMVLIMEFFVYWNLFDGLYNKFRGFDWWFTGSIDKDDAKLDKFQRKHSIRALKISLAAGSTIVYFLTYNLWYSF